MAIAGLVERIVTVRLSSLPVPLLALALCLPLEARENPEAGQWFVSPVVAMKEAPRKHDVGASTDLALSVGYGITDDWAAEAAYLSWSALQGRNDWGMSARIGHSLAAMRQPGSMTPFAEWDVSPQRGRTMLGVRYHLSIPNAPDRLNLEFAAGHGEDQYRGSGAITELRAALRF